MKNKRIFVSTQNQNDKYFDKNSPDEEGMLHFEDKDTMIIEKDLDEPYKFKRE